MPRRNDISKVLVIAIALLAMHAFGCTDIRRPEVVGPVFSVVVTGRYGPQANFEVALQPSLDSVHEKHVARTDSNGVATFYDIAAGSYTVSISHAHMDDWWPVEVDAAADHVHRVALTWPPHYLVAVREIAGSIHGGAAAAFTKIALEDEAGDSIWSGRTANDNTFHLDGRIAPGFYRLKLGGTTDPTYIPVELNRQAKAEHIELEIEDSSCGLQYTNLMDCEPSTVHATRCGVVHDASGGVIPQADVVITSNGTHVSVTTDSNGRFALERLPPGEYEMVISSRAFTPARARMTVTRDLTGNCEIPWDVELNLLGHCSSIRQRGSNR